jgi:predicted nucleic acid-binding protein
VVIVDTSAWVEYFRDRLSPIGEEVARLVISRQALMVGVVYAEILRGARNQQEFQRLIEDFRAVDFAVSDRMVWERAGEVLFELKRIGSMIPFADAVIAAHALVGNHAVFSGDHHFQRVPGLKLHEVGT